MPTLKHAVDVPRLFALWHNGDYTRAEVARELGLTEQQLARSAARHGLGPRGACHRAFSMEDAESPEEEAASADSLALSPWVQARIAELGIQGRREESAVHLVQTRLIVGGRSCSVI